MTPRVLILSAVALALMLGGWLGAASMRQPPPLRTEHSEPARTAPPAMVAVTAEGRLYHKPGCTFVHGPVRMEPGRQAIAEGYTPCTRCLPR